MKDYDIEDAFAAIEEELIASMMRNMKRHHVEEIAEDKQWAMWQAMQLESLERYKKANQKKFGSWFSDINSRIEEVIRKSNKQGYMDQEIEILKAIQAGFQGYRKASNTMQAEFFKLNERKLEILLNAVEHDMEKAEVAILRRADDQYRKAIFNAQVYANSGAGTYEKAVDMATKDMLSSGLKCVVYANGAMHTLSDYADMAIRTANKRAYLQGEGLKRQEWGISTVIVNKRGNPCPKCLPFCGKILIDDVWSGGNSQGKSPVTGLKYPLMSQAIAAGLYHPRCKDSHTTYFEGISTPPDSKYTKEELDQITEDYQKEQRVQYAGKQEEKFGRLAKFSLDSGNRKQYQGRADEWSKRTEQIRNASVPGQTIEEARVKTEKNCKKCITKTSNSDIIELYRKGYPHRKKSVKGEAIIDKATYHKITNPAIKKGADIRIATGEILERLNQQNASAVTYGDVIFFREDATISDVLEEVHHFHQNRAGLNARYRDRQRMILNEIEAKEYVLSMSDKYNIPGNEIELTKKQLKSYVDEMNEMKKRGEWID